MAGSSFSEAISERVTAEQQHKEDQDAMAPVRDPSPVSEELIRTEQLIQDTRGGSTKAPRLAQKSFGPIPMQQPSMLRLENGGTRGHATTSAVLAVRTLMPSLKA